MKLKPPFALFSPRARAVFNLKLILNQELKKEQSMKALIKVRQDAYGFDLLEVDKPKLKADEVLIRVEATGICGSDIPLYKGMYPVKLPVPYIPGHEFSGSIVDVGNDVEHLKTGDRVSAHIVVSCGACYYCRTGRSHICNHSKELGFDINGSFAEYVSFPARNILLLPNNMDFEEGAMLDPLASALHPIERLHLGICDTFAVLGPGPIGLLALQCARTIGAKKVIMVGTRDDRLRVAKELGADEIINVQNENLQERISSVTENGVDVVLEATGSTKAINSALSIVKKDGQIVLISVYHEPASINALDVVYKELSISGSYDYTWLTFKRAMDLISSRKVKVKPIITHRHSLNDFKEAFDLVLSRKAMKVLLKP